MKTGIRLRAYNQKDPLVEYKKESYSLFKELINDIKFNTIKTLQIIQFKQESAEDEVARIAEQLAAEKKIKEETHAEIKKPKRKISPPVRIEANTKNDDAWESF